MEQTLGYGVPASSGGVTTHGRYVQTGASSPRDFHLGPVSVEGAYTPAADHKPTIQAFRWEGRPAKGCTELKGSGAMGFSDGTSHTSATSTLPELTSNPVPAGGAAAK